MEQASKQASHLQAVIQRKSKHSCMGIVFRVYRALHKWPWPWQ